MLSVFLLESVGHNLTIGQDKYVTLNKKNPKRISVRVFVNNEMFSEIESFKRKVSLYSEGTLVLMVV